MRFYNEFHAERRIKTKPYGKANSILSFAVTAKMHANLNIRIYNVPPFGDCCQQVGKNIIGFISGVSNVKIIDEDEQRK